jgi:hypothetical protein
MGALENARKRLMDILPEEIWAVEVSRNWGDVHSRITSWWLAYKAWEKQDTFNDAFKDGRLSVRSFSGDFEWEKGKSLSDLTIPTNKFYADSKYTALKAKEQRQNQDTFWEPTERAKYFANRGLDSSAFSKPENFATRSTKYAAGLHDLSASLLNPKLSIFDQIHHKSEKQAHFSFVPLSAEDDQFVLFTLAQRAKDKNAPSELYAMIRDYRARMTRIKLAQDSDLGAGYTMVPTPNRTDGLNFKMRYGLGDKTTLTGGGATGVKTTPQILAEKQKAALHFKHILGREGKNEIIVALRQHEGNFPVYAVRDGAMLRCFQIVRGERVLDGRTIFSNGRMNA